MKIRSRMILIPALLLFMPAVLNSLDLLNEMQDGEIHGFPTLKGFTDSGTEVIVIRVDPGFHEDLNARIGRMVDSFSIIPLKSVTVTLKPGEKAELAFLCHPFRWKGMDMTDFMVSGFSISIDEWEEYSADLLVNKTSIHLDGYYRGEEPFLDTLGRIIENPGAFLMARDPEYIFDTVQSLTAENEELKAELSNLKYNNLIAENRSIFGAVRPIDRKAVDWIIRAREAGRLKDAEELKTGLLDETGIKADAGTIRLVLGLYFGEFR
jgi:hypothetical protein